jgi:hypothetical protein
VNTAVGWYCIAVGVVMIGWWGLDIRGGALRRPDRAPAEIGLHLVAEMLTAVVLIAGGVTLLTADSVTAALIGLGMLLYTVIQSPGYFLARHEPGPVVMFAVLAALTVAAIGIVAAA